MEEKYRSLLSSGLDPSRISGMEFAKKLHLIVVLVLIDSIDSDSDVLEIARDKRLKVYDSTVSSHLHDEFRAHIAGVEDQLGAAKQFVANVIQGRY